ncbi:hypothetical protein GMD88_18880 [Pseudoflavonifractor sp. BIOML-A6]|nr:MULTISPECIES: stalk domain-containing protein [unclassified Pseudoflavonifractor]MTQ98856.1 hypothetical protein [Pseudoflavonifractor sp. BIOML-A16]MTR08109.1 hypothetical protein [Pseudoflavonifractor sp. BIOML-A15]MTR34363.1 hypothetical protein [Pseudoflavonifractor sp. BIOML-A14]MTR75089.1 hypothetical protein [Pseudoflavonifractor sp. BIOML-A18]MTS66253.1 hypothetical protein [Pseudoflavonifractor sp. BIOML-A5]MTS73610.1 hypothetical protein [Pseudoflavonifractor sp. BIOML-A8]MTS933
MKRIPTFLAGMLTAAVIGGLGVGALAASGAVTFNASNLMFNGQQISAKGEGYTLDNGCQAPASITYTDEKGGGTTYLPVRRISELLDVETGWDGATGSVTVGKAADTTAIPADYSDWSAEEEAAYQEIIGMWDVSFIEEAEPSIIAGKRSVYRAIPTENSPDALEQWDNLSQAAQDKYSYRWMTELRGSNGIVLFLREGEASSIGHGFSIFEDGTFYPGHQ